MTLRRESNPGPPAMYWNFNFLGNPRLFRHSKHTPHHVRVLSICLTSKHSVHASRRGCFHLEKSRLQMMESERTLDFYTREFLLILRVKNPLKDCIFAKLLSKNFAWNVQIVCILHAILGGLSSHTLFVQFSQCCALLMKVSTLEADFPIQFQRRLSLSRLFRRSKTHRITCAYFRYA
jgi:hypothetical protein